jgi:amino-acid N-acetyltransferase
MFARNAVLTDAEAIDRLIGAHTDDGTLLPRSFAELCENIRDFVVVEDRGELIGSGALHLYGVHLAEVRSIAVLDSYRGQGAGRLLIDALLAEAERHNVKCVCLFTRIPEFFARMGFRPAEKAQLPDKLYKDCLRCPRLSACDEVAMIRGEAPNFAILAGDTRAQSLVEIANWL